MNLFNKLFLRGVHRDVAAENDTLRAYLADAYEEARDCSFVLRARLTEIFELRAEIKDQELALKAQLDILRARNAELEAALRYGVTQIHQAQMDALYLDNQKFEFTGG